MKKTLNTLFLLCFVYTCFFICYYLLPKKSFANSNGEIKEIAVVVNRDNLIANLTSKHISEMYLNRRRSFPSGESVLVLEHQSDSELREKFFLLLNGMTLKRINSYWARLQFSGEVQPPPVMPDDIAMLDAVRRNKNAIGYMTSDYVDESVRVILILK